MFLHSFYNNFNMERVFLLVYLCFTVLCIDISAAYVNDPTLCSRTKCSASPDRLAKFKYIEGVTYRYKYQIDVSTNLGEKPNQRRNESTLQIDSIVSLSFTSPCEGYLKLTDSSVSPNRSLYDPEYPDRAGAEFKRSIEEHSLRFAFQDGKVQEVCPRPEEPVWVLNFKKGILSMFQNTMKRFDVDHASQELDINGICDTEYKLHEAKKTSLIVKKSKNIPTCTNRYKYLSVLQSMSYRSPFSSKSEAFLEPLLKSSSECEITIDHNIYEEVNCVESHMLKPLSNGDKTGARTDTRTSLKLIEELSSEDYVEDDDNIEDDSTIHKRMNLLYDHAMSPKPTHGELRLSRDCIKNLCRMGAGEELQQEFSEMFTKLIHSTRLLNYRSLSQLLHRANSICRTGRKHMINALPYVGSNAALAVQKDLIIRKQIQSDKIKDWVTGFALIPRPDRDTLKALSPLLQHQDKMGESQFDLSYSAMIHAFCRTTDDCLRVDTVAQFLRHVELKIAKGCARKSQSPLEMKQTLEALKSIGNMGVETEGLREKLKECVDGAGGYLPMETRLAAIDAHRRLPSCEETRDDYFLNLYRNVTQDTELRIASYLQVMRCPDYNVIKLIKHTLKEEEVNQVGSFVWSHLTNLLKSSSPSRIEIQSLLTDRDLGMKFNSDIRKFSRNYESSFFSDEYNLGANYQTNLIFSPSSYVPRTASVNATVDVFGESINAFEISVRLEGIEYYAENFFGPDGPLSNEKVSSHFKNFLRSLRSAKNENQDFAGEVNRLPNVIDNNFDNPRISIALKVFGNDLQYVVLNGDQEIKETLASIDPWAKFKQILSGKEVKYEKTSMFLDSSYVIPTTTGLPIRLGAAGSAACNFKMSGSLDSKRLASNAEVEVIGNVMPSVSIDVTATMVVDAFYKSAGIKLRSNLYSSGAVRGHLNVKGMQLISLNVGLPNEKIEVFSVLTDVLFISTNGANSEETPVGLIVAGKNPKDFKQSNSVPVVSNRTCSWPELDRLIGLKLCTDYQMSNVTKNPNASYFVLNGPTLFKVSLIKADPTAKSYLLEYRWQRTENQSVIKIAFDTPGSKIKRELSAQISFDGNTRNVSVILHAAGNLLIAKGTYRRSDSEMMIDLGLDINGTKHFDARAGYTRTDGHYGYNYQPTLYLAINNDRVAELSGTIRTSEKSDVSQSDIDLLFVTNKVWSRVLGYIMRRNISIAANIKLEYQLEEKHGSVSPKKETVEVKVELSNHSQKSLTHKVANLTLKSSAYPNLNVDLAAWYRQALGHLEIHVEVNSSPHLNDDGHKLTAQLVLTNSRTYLQNDGAKMSAYISITKPIQKLDIKIGINHFSHGPETKTHGLIRYAPGKEIMLIVNMKMPRGAMFDVEAHVNLTIPAFNPMLIDVEIREKARDEYDLNLAGTWFSGHNITARGTYVDRSTASIVHHTIKLLLKSPSFPTDVIINWKIYLDASDVMIDLQMEQLDKERIPGALEIEQFDQNKYALVVKHSTETPTKFSSYLECRYKHNVYTLTAKVDREREARIEIHLDNWRDVHFIARGIDEPHKTEAGLEIKWDANRDPDLKFATSFQLLKFSSPAEKNITTTVMVTYPGRLVKGVWLLALKGRNNYISDARLEWSPIKFIQFTINADYNMEPNNKIFKIESQLLTPFELWKRTSLNAKYLQNKNAITASSSIYWQDSQHLMIDLSGDVTDDDTTLEWYGNCGLVSTIHPLKWIKGNVTHKQVYGKTADSHLWINYYPDKIVDLKSSWELTKGKDGAFNVTGVLNFVSPLASYERGDVTCSIQFTPDWKVCGAVYVDLDKRKYTGNLVGDLAKLKESMVQFNLTTPIERFSTLHGRLGFSEKNKHVVAKIDGPKGALGIEALCQLFTHGSDFNIKLEVATPIDLLQRSIVVAKLNKKEADFRVGYNNLTAGFQGVWRYLNLTDFHYTYIIYTPLDGLEEVGIVTKLVIESAPLARNSRIDTEFSLRLSDTKIGIAATGGPKPPPFVIPIKIETVTPPANVTTDPNYEDYEDYDVPVEENMYWQGQFLIDAAIFETIVGNLDIDQEESLFKILGSLKIPPGVIRLDDRFYLRDYFTMKNDLKIDTPFEFGSEITSAYVFNIDLDNSVYLIGTDLRIKNNSDWLETGYHIDYRIRTVDDLNLHVALIKVKSPLGFVPYLDGKINVEIEENTYKGKIDIKGKNCLVDLTGSMETDDGFLDSVLLLKVVSPKLVVPKTKILLKKDLASKENRVEFGVEIYEPVLKVFNLLGIWHIEGNDLINASLGLRSPIEMLENLKASIYHVNTISKNDSAKLNLELVHRSVQKYKLIGDYKDKIISVKMNSPIRNYESLEFLGNVVKVSDELFQFSGDLTNERSPDTYKVSGEVRTEKGAISSSKATIVPVKHSTPSSKSVVLNFNKEVHGFKLWSENSPKDISVDFSYINVFNWNMDGKIQSGDHRRVDYQLTGFVNAQANGNLSVHLSGKTPWRSVDNFMIDGNMLVEKTTGVIRTSHHFNRDSSSFEFTWGLVFMQDMFGRIVLGYNIDEAKKHIDTQLFYKNYKTFRNLSTGFNFDIDHEAWKFAGNLTLGMVSKSNFDAIISLTLPPPDKDSHTILISYHTQEKTNDFKYAVGYSTQTSQRNYASDGSFKKNPQDVNGHLRVTWGLESSQTVNNLFNATFQNKEISFDYSLITPKFQQETFVLRLNYDGASPQHCIINANVYYPATKEVGTARIVYASIANVNGTVKASTPFPGLDHMGCNFILYTTLKQNKRKIEVFWPSQTALLDSDYSYNSERLDSNLEGILRVEIPLNTRHNGLLTYGYKKRPLITNGHSELTYNGESILQGQYNSKSESRAGFEKDHIEISIQNSYKPIGILYINQYEYSAGNEGTNYPTVESKQVNIYRLGNSSEFNVAGESRIRTNHNGQDIELKAIHFNRTVKFHTDYRVLPGEFDHNSRLSLATDAWASYHVNILNKTTEDVENQFLVLNFAYPRRNFSLDGSYRISSTDISSEAKLEWDKDTDRPRNIGTGFEWNKMTDEELQGQQQAVLRFKHPSFEKDVTFTAKLDKRDPQDLVNVGLVVDYSPMPDKLLVLSGKLRDDSTWPSDRRYSYEIIGRHPNTFLDLQVNGSLHKHAFVFVKMGNYATYKRSYLPVENGQLFAYFDLSKYEIELKRENKETVKYLKARYYPAYPEFVVNGSMIKTPDLNATGHFFLNIDQKLTWMMVNYTPDALESLRMYGKIPDARNAVFDIWRTYAEDLTISDVAFYLRLNHSRLVTSTLKWRPELKEDITGTIRSSLNTAYESIGSDADYWKKYIRSETVSAISDVWNDAQYELGEFLDDWNNLKDLRTDLEDLQIYLNESYNANEFYLKDIVGFGSYVIDELSLRSHIQSLPNIFNEIWDIMGESGLAIRNSLIWAIEAIKSGYNKLSEIVTAIMKGDSMAQIAIIVEKIVEKYDNFVKDLHVSFIKYMENLWAKMSVAASDQWSKFLRYVEPMFIKVIHYLETVLWKASKEVLDFLYDRRTELMTSPYFDRFTNFTQDVDKIYKDIKAHDIVTNVRKYSGIIIQFIKERYFTMVPFGRELKNVIDDIIAELQELTKLPSVSYAIDKGKQLYAKVKYLYDYFEVGDQINQAIKVIHSKFTDISQTALQAENRYREAKTKFIFSPQAGLLCLEQKLPMSWHAFNQTPEFQEIPEYRAIADMRSYFVTSNMTFWTLYYQYKPYTEPSSWLPPFKAQAMIAGGQHYMTFDSSYYEFSGECTYLLAQDFIKHQFAVLVKYNVDGGHTTHQIIVLIGGKAIQLDLFKNSVRSLDSELGLQLPVHLGDGEAYVYQEDNTVVVESQKKLFRLECNMKFDLCLLELSGWYYGKTAGLFGTMSNEQTDDFLTSHRRVVKDVGEFAQSWSLNNTQCTGSKNLAYIKPPKANGFQICEDLFVNKSSELSSCFNIVDPNPYQTMCLNSRTENEACTVAVAYIQVCLFHDTYLRIPDHCTRCDLVNGSEVKEGEFRKLEGDSVPQSSDIVFIVEAKSCNMDVKTNISLDQILPQLNKEFNQLNLTDLRWSLITFGGDGVYDQPRSLVINGETFTSDHKHFLSYFDHIPIGNGSQDIFAALRYASQLGYRAGVSKTFILLPCSHCEPQNQKLDYSVLHQVLLEHDTTLHILMDADFELEKAREGRFLYGLDASNSYTRKDTRVLTGDKDLRRQVKLSKSILGYCTPLALETNGTVFSGQKLRFEKPMAIKKIANVFSKRVAASAAPSACQHCECISDNSGMTKMECIPCVYPTPVIIDYEGFNEDESLAVLQPFDFDYPSTDMEME